MRKPVKHVAALLVFTSLLICSCAPSGAPESQGELTKVTICQYAEVFVYLPLYIAQEKGFFELEGLDVSLINGGGDDKTFAAVASGQAQFGVADPTFAAIAREKGQPGVVVASVVSGAAFWGVTKKNEVPEIKTPAQLKDLRIATYRSPSTNYTLMANTLQNNSEQVGNARIVQGAFGTLLAMLDAQAADVAMELEPTVSTAVKAGARVVYSYPEMYGPFLLTGLYTTEQVVQQNPELVQKAVNALERAVRFAHAEPDGAVAVARKVFPNLDEEVVTNAVHRMLDAKTIPEHVTLDPEGWRNAIQVRLDVGDLKSSEAADATINDTFAEKAAQSL